MFFSDREFIRRVCALVRWHMQFLFVVNSMKFADIQTMAEQIEIQEVALLGLCDRLGRGRPDEEKESRNYQIFLEKCKQAEGEPK